MPASLVKGLPDAATVFASDLTPSVVTASGNTASLVFPATPNAEYWPAPQNTLPLESAVIVEVTAISGTGATATFAIQASANGTFSDEVVVASSQPITAAGTHTFALVKGEVERLLPASTAFRLAYTLGGTTPSVTFAARLEPFFNAN